MAAEKFPGKGSKPGMYTMPNGDERYYAGGNDFYRSAPGGGAQLFGELTNGSGWRGMSQFDNFNDGRSKGGVAAQNSNMFAQNFQTFFSPNDSPLRSVIGPNPEDPNKTPEVIAPTVPTRDVQKANGAKGTQTSPGGGMPTLTAAGAAAFYQSVGIGGFMSNQLPGTTSSADVKGNQEAVPFGGQETSVTKNTLGAFSATDGQAYAALDPSVFTTKMPAGVTSQFSQFGGMSLGNGADTFAPSSTAQGGKGYTEIKPSDPMFAEAFGQKFADKQAKGNTSRLNAALNDKAGMQSYMSKFGSPEQDRMRAANMAFLNAEGPGSSQLGLRAKEAVLGQIHAGGETYQLNSDRTELIQDKDGNAIAADRDAASAFKGGTMGAEEYRNSFKNAVKAKAAEQSITPVTPKQAENPFVQNPAAVSTAFTTNIAAGTMAPGSAEIGGMMDVVRGIDGTPPMSSQQISDSFLNKREPLMRDPRKK